MIIIPGVDTFIEEKTPRYGLWMFRDKAGLFPVCSHCGEVTCGSPTDYCAECGATMLNQIEAKRHLDLQLANIKAMEERKNERND